MNYVDELLHKSLKLITALENSHREQEITLPDGSWGLNCLECDGLSYPCRTMKLIKAFMS